MKGYGSEALAPGERGQLLELIERSGRLIVLVLRPDGTCVLARGAPIDRLPAAQVGLEGRNLFEVYEHRPDIVEMLRRALSGEAFVEEVEAGSVVLRSLFAPLLAPDGSPAGAACVSADVTSERAVEAAERREQDARRGLLVHIGEVEDAERRRIAADVHDDQVQVMSAAVLRVETLLRHLDRLPPAEVRRRLAGLTGDIRAATERLRGLVFDLEPPQLGDRGVAVALRELALVRFAGTGISWDVECQLDGEPPERLRGTVYRIAHEALRNVVDHAQARHVDVRLSKAGGGVLLEVLDDGVGLDLARVREAGHHGLAGMRDRALAAGGTCEIRTRPSGGTSVRAWLPRSGDLLTAVAAGAPLPATVTDVLDSVSEAVTAMDSEWRYVFVNRAAARLTGREAGELLGQVVWEAWPELVGTPLQAAFHRAVETQEAVDHEHRTRDGRWFENHISPSSRGVTCFVRDVTDERKTRAEVSRLDAWRQTMAEAQAVLLRGADRDEAVDAYCAACRDGFDLTDVDVRVGVVLAEAPSPYHQAVPLRVGDRDVGTLLVRYPGGPPRPRYLRLVEQFVAPPLALRLAAG